MEYLDFRSGSHSFRGCLDTDTYLFGGGIAIELYIQGDDGPEPFAGLTVNLADHPAEGNSAYVDVNNFPEAEKLITDYGLGEPTGRYGFSGFCRYPEYRFHPEAIGRYRLPSAPEPEAAVKSSEGR